ncbi:unnamed protein product [Lactuca saligna]|uniref:Uncharacterized protein n=1 Tax=Lactuca saligna TaxID=75948 RepID=A0AA36E7T9_LACSI|nr:unnamed protein product [Lactuca saligna]
MLHNFPKVPSANLSGIPLIQYVKFNLKAHTVEDEVGIRGVTITEDLFKIASTVIRSNVRQHLGRCRHLPNSRSLVYLPSVMVAAIMFLVLKVIDPDNSLDYQERVKGFLQIKEGWGGSYLNLKSTNPRTFQVETEKKCGEHIEKLKLAFNTKRNCCLRSTTKSSRLAYGHLDNGWKEAIKSVLTWNHYVSIRWLFNI